MTAVFVCSQPADLSAIALRGYRTVNAADWKLPELHELRGRSVRVLRHDARAARGAAAVLAALSCDVRLIERDVDPATADLLAEPAAPMFVAPPDAPDQAEGDDLDCEQGNTPGDDLDALAGDLGPRVQLIRGDAITPEPVRWLWRGWLARGKFHVLAGRPAAGKTTLALALAATITTGGRWPDGTPAEVGDVLIWSGEDDPADTLVPRLLANGADLSRVHFVGDVRHGGGPLPFDPARHMTALEREAARIGGVRLLIVDPVVSAVSGDGNSNTEVRRALQPVVDLAARIDCAALGISHFTKGSDGRDVVDRVTGSLAFGAAARVVLAAVKAQAADGATPARILARAKSNIGPDDGGFGFDVEQIELPAAAGVTGSRVLWGGPVEGAARDLLRQAEGTADDDPGGDPRAFLADLLRGGPLPAVQVFKDAEAHGYSRQQMRRARERLNVETRKGGMRDGWLWALSEDAEATPEGVEGAEGAGHTRPASSAPSASSATPSGGADPAGEVF